MSIGPKNEGVLYHYTNHDALYSIVEGRAIRASHAYFLNDANEIKYAVDRFLNVVDEVVSSTESGPLIILLSQISSWIQNMRNNPHYIFVFSLSEKGNLLSQWRAYTNHGTGVSLGFNTADLEDFAKANGLSLVKCVYDKNEQLNLLKQLVDAITNQFLSEHHLYDISKRPKGQEYHQYLNRFTEPLLRSFVKIKDPAFHEEEEWRLISRFYEKYVDPDIRFRSGKTTLVPYIEINLDSLRKDHGLFEQVIVGPSPNFQLAFSSIAAFLSNKKACNITMNSQQPYREI